MSLVPSLLQAIVRVDGDALVMHPGDKPYVVSPTGQVALASRGLTLEAVDGIVSQLLPPELQRVLDEFGAVQYDLPAASEFPGEHFTIVAARGGDDVWMEIRRRRVPDNDQVPDDLFGPSASPLATATPIEARPGMVAVSLIPQPVAAAPVAATSMPSPAAAVPTTPSVKPPTHKRAAIRPSAKAPAQRVRPTGAVPALIAKEDEDRDYVPVDALGFDPREESRTGAYGPDDDLLLPDAAQLWPERVRAVGPNQDPGDVEVNLDADLDDDGEKPPALPPVWQPSQLQHGAPADPGMDVQPPQHVAPMPVITAAPAGAVALPQADGVPPSQLGLEAEREVGKLKKEAGELLDAVRRQVDTLGEKQKDLEAFDERIRALHSGVGDAESRVDALTAKGVEALTAKDRNLTGLTEKVDGLSNRFETLFAQADDLNRKQVALETLHERLGEVDDLARKTTSELDSLRQSHEDLDVLRREIQEFSTTHADAARLAEKLGADRLGLEAFGERLEALAAKDKNLTGLTEKVDGLSNRFETLFAQADDLNRKQVALETLHERLGEVDDLARKTTSELDSLRQSHEDLDVLRREIQEFSTTHADAARLAEKLGADRLGLEAFGERLEALAAKDKNLTGLTEKVDGLSNRFETLFVQADDLTKKQVAFETLHERLGEVDDLARKTTSQLGSLRQSHEDLDVLRREIQEFSTTHADAARLAEKLGADRLGLEAFADRMTAFATLAPELEAKMDAITGKLQLVEDGTQKAERLHESVAELDAQISRVSEHVPLVEKLGGRLNDLNRLSGDLDRKLEDQLARRAELETLKVVCDRLEGQMAGAQHELEAVRALQTTLVPLVAEVTKLKADIGGAEFRLEGAKVNEVGIIEQEKRYGELVAAGKVVATEVAERWRQMQALAEELARSSKMKDEMLVELDRVQNGQRDATRQMHALAEELARSSRMKDEMLVELDRVQGRQRDAARQMQASEDRFARAENMFKQQEARRSDAPSEPAAMRLSPAAVVVQAQTVDVTPVDVTPVEALPQAPVAVLAPPLVVLPPPLVVPPPLAVPPPPIAMPPPDAVLPSQPAVVLPISRKPLRSEQRPPSAPDPTPSGLERLLRVSSARGASTLHLASGSRPFVRVDGELQVLDGEPVHAARDVESLLLTLMPERSHEALRTGADNEWICEIEGVGRVRCMSFRDHRGPGGVFRLMPTRSVSADELRLPRQVQSLAMEREGLVLVAGSRSSGKRTLISAFVDLMNRTRRDHVITIERKINIVHDRGSAFVSQREVRGNDDDVVAAARAAMREDPDVLVIDELHPAALMNVALEASAGRLVIGGVSAQTATGAIDRIIDLCAPEHRREVQVALADSLRGVVVQVLLPKIGGGRLPALEVLLNTPAVSSAIVEGKTSQLPGAIEGGRRHGMIPLNDSLVGLVQIGVVEGPEAYRRSTDRPGFLAALNQQGIDTSFVERLA